MAEKFKREGTYIYLWLIHVDVWTKSQYCKAIILQVKLKKTGKCSCKNSLMTKCRSMAAGEGSERLQRSTLVIFGND